MWIYIYFRKYNISRYIFKFFRAQKFLKGIKFLNDLVKSIPNTLPVQARSICNIIRYETLLEGLEADCMCIYSLNIDHLFFVLQVLLDNAYIQLMDIIRKIYSSKD